MIRDLQSHALARLYAASALGHIPSVHLRKPPGRGVGGPYLRIQQVLGMPSQLHSDSYSARCSSGLLVGVASALCEVREVINNGQFHQSTSGRTCLSRVRGVVTPYSTTFWNLHPPPSFFRSCMLSFIRFNTVRSLAHLTTYPVKYTSATGFQIRKMSSVPFNRLKAETELAVLAVLRACRL